MEQLKMLVWYGWKIGCQIEPTCDDVRLCLLFDCEGSTFGVSISLYIIFGHPAAPSMIPTLPIVVSHPQNSKENSKYHKIISSRYHISSVPNYMTCIAISITLMRMCPKPWGSIAGWYKCWDVRARTPLPNKIEVGKIPRNIRSGKSLF